FGFSRVDARARIDDVAIRLGVADRLDDRVSTLSGGLRRRVDLARALLTSPEILYLDEPTTGLDHASRVAFLETLGATRRERPITIVLATHLMDEAAHADRVVMLSEGRIVADGAQGELREALG